MCIRDSSKRPKRYHTRPPRGAQTASKRPPTKPQHIYKRPQTHNPSTVVGRAEGHQDNANVSTRADDSYPPPHDVPRCAKAAPRRADATLI
eukprot:1280623-Pyramimonas_sp.AAC.1